MVNRIDYALVSLIVVLLFCGLPIFCSAAEIREAAAAPAPIWEPLLWGGKIDLSSLEEDASGESADAEPGGASPADLEPGGKEAGLPAAAGATPSPASIAPGLFLRPVFIASFRPPALQLDAVRLGTDYQRDPYRTLALKNIPPLYVTPKLPGEGVWVSDDMPADGNGWPVMYRTSYRPSSEYPTAIVHMLLVDMKRVSMRLYIGSAEPRAPKGSSMIDQESKPLLLAITNALWKQKHSGGAGAIFRGEVLQEMAPGMASIVIYNDDSVDILEWNSGIPVSLVRDARQLRHLIVRNGKVVSTVIKAGEKADSEIGLGFLLSEEPQPPAPYWGGYYFGNQSAVNFSEDWFIATRSAFGIRRDGNLVFAVGHHISTKDLAKALVLAGCDRAIHGDANPHNVLGNLYHVDETGRILRKFKLSPEQQNSTLNRYVDRSYTSDFFAFFKKPVRKDPS